MLLPGSLVPQDDTETKISGDLQISYKAICFWAANSRKQSTVPESTGFISFNCTLRKEEVESLWPPPKIRGKIWKTTDKYPPQDRKVIEIALLKIPHLFLFLECCRHSDRPHVIYNWHLTICPMRHNAIKAPAYVSLRLFIWVCGNFYWNHSWLNSVFLWRVHSPCLQHARRDQVLNMNWWDILTWCHRFKLPIETIKFHRLFLNILKTVC